MIENQKFEQRTVFCELSSSKAWVVPFISREVFKSRWRFEGPNSIETRKRIVDSILENIHDQKLIKVLWRKDTDPLQRNLTNYLNAYVTSEVTTSMREKSDINNFWDDYLDGIHLGDKNLFDVGRLMVNQVASGLVRAASPASARSRR